MTTLSTDEWGLAELINRTARDGLESVIVKHTKSTYSCVQKFGLADFWKQVNNTGCFNARLLVHLAEFNILLCIFCYTQQINCNCALTFAENQPSVSFHQGCSTIWLFMLGVFD